jgi:hypothetical protein
LQTAPWKTYFESLKGEGLFDGSDIDINCLRFLYMPELHRQFLQAGGSLPMVPSPLGARNWIQERMKERQAQRDEDEQARAEEEEGSKVVEEEIRRERERGLRFLKES